MAAILTKENVERLQAAASQRDLTVPEMIEYLQMHGAMAQTIAQAPIISGPSGGPVVNDMQRTAHALNAKMFTAAAAMLEKSLMPIPLARLQVMVNTMAHDLDKTMFVDKDHDAIQAVIGKHLVAASMLHQRVFDLLRHQRSELLAADLITLQEYGWLSAEAAYWSEGDPEIPGQGSLGVQRLESYDDHTNRMRNMRLGIGHAIVTCPVCGPHPDQPPCATCQKLKGLLQHVVGDEVRRSAMFSVFVVIHVTTWLIGADYRMPSGDGKEIQMPGTWELVGIFTEEHLAVAECLTVDHMYAPIRLDESQRDPGVIFPAAKWPMRATAGA
jgi:hypothetical protein